MLSQVVYVTLSGSFYNITLFYQVVYITLQTLPGIVCSITLLFKTIYLTLPMLPTCLVYRALHALPTSYITFLSLSC